MGNARKIFAILGSTTNGTASNFLTFGVVFILLLGISLGSICGNNNSYLIKAFGQTDNSPAFQDSYWTDNLSSIPGARQTKVEVGPGEGSSTLAIVLVNKARQDITGVRGALTLPEGFEAVRSPMYQINNGTTNSTGGIDGS